MEHIRQRSPRPDASVKKMKTVDLLIQKHCYHKNTYVAPFVNAEEAQYLVIENAFPNGRPALENTGVISRERQ